VGSLGELSFKPGVYLYCGSALSGIFQRTHRHIREDKKIFWHIDYLTNHKKPDFIDVFISERRLECEIADFLKNHFNSINNFGSGDCNCQSHLFFLKRDILKKARDEICLKAIKDFGILNTFSLYY
jgi:Uri superfamily endonuclease